MEAQADIASGSVLMRLPLAMAFTLREALATPQVQQLQAQASGSPLPQRLLLYVGMLAHALDPRWGAAG